MRNNQLHIILAESSALVQAGLTQLLSKSGITAKWYEVDSFSEAQRLMQMHSIDIVILNPQLALNMEKNLQALKGEYEEVKWVALVYSLFDPSLLGLFDSVIHLNDSPDTIAAVISRSVEGEKPEDSTTRQPLSDREIDVLKLLVTGFSNKEIADKLVISTHTVITHRKNITQKTGIKSVSGLTIYAVVKGIISLNNVPE
jgi:DNA-binding NarL/FixJ family response regulator